MPVKVGTVATFRNAEADKEQAKKVLEEAAEVYAAWQTWDEEGMLMNDRMKLLGECADLITATCNMVSALGVEDMRSEMAKCEFRNSERGRS